MEEDFFASMAGVADDATDESKKNGPPKKMKRRIVMCLGYVGSQYHGLQMMTGASDRPIPTIEEELFRALIKTDLCHHGDPKHIEDISGWSRASRTDKGVHAANNVVSFTILMKDDIVEKLNSALPESIRIFGYVQHRGGFMARQECETRDYEYLIPTWAFQRSSRHEDNFPYATTPFVYTEALATLLSAGLQKFKGTHNFHNFTKSGHPNSPQSVRHLRSLSLSDPFLLEGVEYVVVKLKGQSFLLNMIRKIIGLLITVGRGDVGLEVFDYVFSKEVTRLATAPGNGLLLDTVYFTHMNELWVPKGYSAVDFNTPHYTALREAYKTDTLYPHISQVEKSETPMQRFTYALDRYPLQRRNVAVVEPVVAVAAAEN